MKNTFSLLLLVLLSLSSCKQTKNVIVASTKDGMRLVVNGKDFMINGMNWDYFPRGTNYAYSLWKEKDALIKEALDAEMQLLQEMGVNTIRVYTGIPPKWISYIYKEYGIYTLLNHSFGRYGLTINGAWVAATDYGSINASKVLLAEVSVMAEKYKNTPGLLLYLLGNENNYGLFWAGAETEDFPNDEKEIIAKGEQLGRPMYRLMNSAAKIMKEIDKNHLVAICNGDVGFLEIIAEECKDVDVYGTNMYRGKSFGDAFEVVKNTLNMPIMFTEFGADAFDAVLKKENQEMQAYYMLENWKEIYQNAAGFGKAGNAIGGFTFQFSDGWWKYGQTKNLNIQDDNASWASGGYRFDYVKGSNNMNEEWFGICAKEATNKKGLYTLKPRAAYYALQKVHQLKIYSKETSLETITHHFSAISLKDALNSAK